MLFNLVSRLLLFLECFGILSISYSSFVFVFLYVVVFVFLCIFIFVVFSFAFVYVSEENLALVARSAEVIF